MPAHELELLRSAPVFPAMLDAAHTIPRELQAEAQYRLEPGRFSKLRTPTVFLLGSDSPPANKATLDAWHTALPHSRIAVFPGQQHIAHFTAPELFVAQVTQFLLKGR